MSTASTAEPKTGPSRRLVLPDEHQRKAIDSLAVLPE